MKITKKYLQNIVKEELQGILREQAPAVGAPAGQPAQPGSAPAQASGGAGGVMSTDEVTKAINSATHAFFKAQKGKHPAKEGKRAALLGNKHAFAKAEERPKGDGFNVTAAQLQAWVAEGGNAALKKGPPRVESKFEREGKQAGLEGKYLAAYVKRMGSSGARFSRGQRQNFIKNFLAKQQSGA